MGFSIETTAELRNVNIRGENHGDEPATGIDLRFFCEDVPVATVFSLLGIDGDKSAEEAVMHCFWDNDGKEQRYSGIERIVSWASFEKCHHLSGELGPKETVSKLGKFDFKPRACGRVDLAFSCAISEPGDDLILRASHSVKSRVKICIEHDPELPLEGGANSSPEQE